MTEKYDVDDLLYLMSRLRDPDRGCPWDIKQTFESLVPYTLEEAYEVADAIGSGNRQDIRDELGDLLFQVIFYSQMAKEEGSFEFQDVVNGIVTKLVRRHPHVFPDKELRDFHPAGKEFSQEQVKQQWEAIKSEERRLKASQQSKADENEAVAVTSILDDIPAALPSINRAEKLQKRASQHGFDWPDLPPVFDKLNEEVGELREVVATAHGGDLRETEVHARLIDEMGDILFCCVNLARFIKVNPDEALRSANQKFQKRFHFIEKELIKRDVSLQDASLEVMGALWDRAKLELD